MYQQPFIREKLASVRAEELERQAEAYRVPHHAGRVRRRLSHWLELLLRGHQPREANSEIRIRYASPADAPSLRRLADRAGANPPPPPVLVIDVDDALLVAKSLSDGALIADPACPDPGLEALVGLRAAQLADAAA
jgi:hypothetical protein